MNIQIYCKQCNEELPIQAHPQKSTDGSLFIPVLPHQCHRVFLDERVKQLEKENAQISERYNRLIQKFNTLEKQHENAVQQGYRLAGICELYRQDVKSLTMSRGAFKAALTRLKRKLANDND